MHSLSSVYEHHQSVYGWLTPIERKTYARASSVHTPAKIHDLDWADMVFRYDGDCDIFRLFFIKTTPEMKKTEQPLAKDVFAILDGDSKILLLEFRNASKNLGCHLLDYPSEIDCWPACALIWSYDNSTDALDIHFMSPELVQARFKTNAKTQKEYKHTIILDLDAEKRYISIEVLGASKFLRKQSAGERRM